MEVLKSIFKAYDIRGIYEKELSLDSVSLIAKALCEIYKTGNDKIVVGRDGRISSSAISKSVSYTHLTLPTKA